MHTPQTVYVLSVTTADDREIESIWTDLAQATMQGSIIASLGGDQPRIVSIQAIQLDTPNGTVKSQ